MGITLGIDVGTSACKALLRDATGRVLKLHRCPLPAPHRQGAAWTQDPEIWWRVLLQTLTGLLADCPQRHTLTALALDGTSATLLATDAAGRPLAPALLYADSQATAEAAQLRACAPPDSPAQGPSSSLAKGLYLLARHPRAVWLLHQADWLTGRLLGQYGTSDSHNALKLGYDVQAETWPAWVRQCVPPHCLPRVYRPGTVLGTLHPALARTLGVPAQVRIVAGTTDSTAAFLATGAGQPGDAVTSLGSTLVLKIVAPVPVQAAAYGVYSHRLGQTWLVGGASNSGAAVLQAHFSPDALARLTPQLCPEQATGLDYYPLLTPGERFPHADPHWPPRLTPRPASDAIFLQGLLEGLTRIEAAGYQRLMELGAPTPQRIYTTGGGSANPVWQQLRARMLPAPLCAPRHMEAAYGAARLAAAPDAASILM